MALTMSYEQAPPQGALRPVNLRTDLAALADLIELVFNDTMDANGRAAIREMRYMSRLGPGLTVLSRMNESALGGSLGYVWEEDGRLVGNVSLFAADWPRELGRAWIIANVGVHPDFRRRGIARRLMRASMDLARKRGGRYAFLQVDADNPNARTLYEDLGFVVEREWTSWRRSSLSPRTPHDPAVRAHITRRRNSEWRAEYALAERVRPPEQGGLGWLTPLQEKRFHPSWLSRLTDLFSLRTVERLVIHDAENARALAASLWVESGFAASTRLQLITLPEVQDTYGDALLNNAVRRYGHTPILIDHPSDETVIGELLKGYAFRAVYRRINMRWDVR